MRADDWTGQWSDMSVELLYTREVYRSDITNAAWKTLINYVATLTFEKLGVSVLRRQMFNDLPVSGNYASIPMFSGVIATSKNRVRQVLVWLLRITPIQITASTSTCA